MNITTYKELVSFPWDYWLVRVESSSNYPQHLITLIVVKNGISYEVIRHMIFASTTYNKLRVTHNGSVCLRIHSRDTNNIDILDRDSSNTTKCNTLQEVLELLERLIMMENL